MKFVFSKNRQPTIQKEFAMWTKPTYQNVRLGFEITMYFSVR
ncbi:pyrroloquinoline quinone precursor peptide PqqA [Ketobacter sp.]